MIDAKTNKEAKQIQFLTEHGKRKSHSIIKLVRTRQRIGLYMDFYSNQQSLSFVFAMGVGRVTYCNQSLECEAQLFHQEERRGGGGADGGSREIVSCNPNSVGSFVA